MPDENAPTVADTGITTHNPAQPPTPPTPEQRVPDANTNPPVGEPADTTDWRVKYQQAMEAQTELAEKAKAWDEAQEQLKTDAQRQAEALDKARATATKAQAENAALNAALRHGISADYLGLLGTNGSPDEIDARAKQIGQLVQDQAMLQAIMNTAAAEGENYTAPPTVLPVANLRPGITPAQQRPVTPDDAYPSGWVTPRK